MVSITEAAHCPKCGVLGRLAKSNKTRADSGELCDVAVYHCTNDGCSWYNTGWLVQSDERGQVYERDQGTRGQDKTFQPMSRDQQAAGQRAVEDLLGRDLRDKDEPQN